MRKSRERAFHEAYRREARSDELEIDRALKQEELAKVDRELARVTVDRDTTARRLQELEAVRIAGGP